MVVLEVDVTYVGLLLEEVGERALELVVVEVQRGETVEVVGNGASEVVVAQNTAHRHIIDTMSGPESMTMLNRNERRIAHGAKERQITQRRRNRASEGVVAQIAGWMPSESINRVGATYQAREPATYSRPRLMRLRNAASGMVPVS